MSENSEHSHIAADNQPRCLWCQGYDDFIPYHDNEWGFPVDDDQGCLKTLPREFSVGADLAHKFR